MLEKSFRISNNQHPKYSIGDIINFGTSDNEKFGRVSNSLLFMVYIPVSIAVGIYFLYQLVGVAFLPAIGFLSILMVFNFFYAKAGGVYLKEVMANKGKRVTQTTELLNNIRFIKSNCLELFFGKKVEEIREKEIFWMTKMNLRLIFTLFNIYFTPALMNVSCFATYLWMGKDLTIAIIFTTISVMRNFNFGLAFLPTVLSSIIDFVVSSQRLIGFFTQEEIIQLKNEHRANDNFDVEIKNVDFTSKSPNFIPEKKENKTKEKPKENGSNQLTEVLIKTEDGQEKPDDQFYLRDINLKIKKGELVAIIGSNGSGKSTLCFAILNEMYGIAKEDSKFASNKDVAFVSQKPWIMNETLKENILFGIPFDQHRYERTLKLSCLEEDLKELDKGDNTVIGDKGVNLSGGQKTRVAIARALYTGRQMLIMDDPLSALDVNVGNQVFENTIKQDLKTTTRIIVTHNIVYLKYFDRILMMDKGRMIYNGDYEELLKHEKYQEFEKVLQENQKKIEEMSNANKPNEEENEVENGVNENEEEQKNSEISEDKVLAEEIKTISTQQTGGDKMALSQHSSSLPRKLSTKVEHKVNRQNIEEEMKDKGDFSLRLMLSYFKLGSLPLLFLMFICFGIMTVANIKKYFFYNYRASSPDEKFDTNSFIIQMVIIESIYVISTILRGTFSSFSCLNVSANLNKLMMFKILHASLPTFFNKNPTGKILNRLSGDMENIDFVIPFTITILFNLLSQTVVNMYLIVVLSSGWVFLLILVYLVIIMRMQNTFKRSYTEITRMASSTKSPFFHLYGDAINGITDIRILNREKHMINTMAGILDVNFKCTIVQEGLTRWFRMRVALLSMIFVIPSFCFLIYYEKNFFSHAAILVSVLIGNIDTLIFMMNNLNELDKNFISFDRCSQFLNMDFEPGLTSAEKQYNSLLKGKSMKDLEDEERAQLAEYANTEVGEVHFNNVSVRYQPNLPHVLKDINIVIHKNENIGIVGRTGSGKSTLISTFLRFFDKIDGTLEIDGKSVYQMDPKKVRMNVAYIFQDTTFFEGSLRSNLDPFNRHSDQKIIDMLTESSIYESIELKADSI